MTLCRFFDPVIKAPFCLIIETNGTNRPKWFKSNPTPSYGSIRQDRHHGQHASGPAFFHAVGIILVRIGGGADAAIARFANSEIRELAEDFRGKIDFVVWRTDAGRDLGDEIGWGGSGGGAEGLGSDGGDPEFGALLSGMHEGDATSESVGKKNGGAVGDVNAEADARNGCEEPVGIRDGEMRVGGDFGNPIAMDLLGRGESHRPQPGVDARLQVVRVQFLKRFLPLDTNVQSPDPAGEDSTDSGNRVKGGKDRCHERWPKIGGRCAVCALIFPNPEVGRHGGQP